MEYLKKRGYMIKSLIHHGNSRALLIDKATLEAAGLDEDKALFQITVNPNGGIVILHKETFRQALKENDALIKRLAKR